MKNHINLIYRIQQFKSFIHKINTLKIVRKHYIGCGGILLYMNPSKTSTNINWADKILIPFVNDDGHIEFTDDIDPEYIAYMNSKKTIPNIFLITLENDICPYCNCKLNRSGTVDFYLNNTILVKKQKYQCSNKECKHCKRSLWEKYIEPGCNYTKKIKEFSLELGLICNISYEKITEIIKLTKHVNIRRDTLFKFFKENSEEFLSKKEKENEEERIRQNIKFSKVLSYDEQYVSVEEDWKYRLTGMDPVTKWVYKTKYVEKDDFTHETIKEFIQSIMDITPITTLVTDGSKRYPKVAEELGLKHKLCNFHKMQNYIDLIKKEYNRRKRKNKGLKTKLETIKEQIKEIEEKRKGKWGRMKKDDKTAEKLIKDKKNLNRKKSKIKDEIKENNAKIEAYDSLKKGLSGMLKSKAEQTGHNRYGRILNKSEQIPEYVLKFVKDMEKELDKLLSHTTDPDIPTTNNIIELLFLTTLNYHNKRKYRTDQGVETETRLKTIRWNRRVALGKI